MSIENTKQNQSNNNTYSRSTEEHYKQVPMDLNSSPLEELFREMFIPATTTTTTITTTTTAAPSAASISPTLLKTKPVSIPGAYNMKNHVNASKRERKGDRGSHSVPTSMNSIAIHEYDERPPFVISSPGTQTKYPSPQLGNSVFIVGSLENKPPAPWPSSLTSPHNKIPRHYRTTDWPVSYPHITSAPNGEDDQSVFSMDDDYHSASDFYDEDDTIVFDRS